MSIPLTKIETDALLVRDVIRLLPKVDLSPYEARVLSALVNAGRAVNSNDLHEVSAVPRTSIYAAARHLVKRGLIVQVDTSGVAVWRCGDWAEVLDALDAYGDKQMTTFHDGVERLRKVLAP